MKSIAFISLILAACTVSAVTIPSNAITQTSDIAGIGGTFLVPSGASIQVTGFNNDIYVRAGGAITSITGISNNIYYESGATISNVTGFNNKLQLVTFDGGGSGEPSGKEWVPDWAYTGQFPWIYSVSDGWLYFAVVDGVPWLNKVSTGEWRKIE